MDGFARLRYVLISVQKLPKLSLKRFLEIFTWEKKSADFSCLFTFLYYYINPLIYWNDEKFHFVRYINTFIYPRLNPTEYCSLGPKMISYQPWLNFHAGGKRQILLIYKSTENHKIFIVTLTKTLVCWVIRSWVIQVYTIHKSSQLLSVWSISAYIQYIFKKYHYFSSNWLCSKFSLIYSDRGVKLDIFGDISVF